MRLLIVGNRGGTNVGERFELAAAALGLEVRLLEAARAMAAPAPLRRFNWYLRGRRPTRLAGFGRLVTGTCAAWRPDVLLTTGVAPVPAGALARLGALGVTRVSFLTDDPWNPAHRAPWFLAALPGYDVVLSPRRANLGDLRALGCRAVHYLPFAYAPELHYPDPPRSEEEARRYDADVVFVGTGDADRAPLVGALAAAGLRLGLYGSYWERFPATAPHARGQAGPDTVRRATSAARVALGLVRRANRDGHTMRSFEIPAIGACFLAEDTAEHRELFGGEGRAVAYFRDRGEMVEQVRRLLADAGTRQRLARAARARITGGGHTYRERLQAILELAAVPADAAGAPGAPTPSVRGRGAGR